jgi:hypothetical protein
MLSAAGWSPPRIGQHLGRHPHTVRAALKGFAARGAQALYPDKPGPEPDHARRAKVTDQLAQLLGQDRTWTSRQLAEALGPDLGTGHRQIRRYLALLKAGYRRTAQTVGLKQDPQKVERAGRVLGGLKKSPGGPVGPGLGKLLDFFTIGAKIGFKSKFSKDLCLQNVA